MEEELSLGTFEPHHAQPPYLNSPRSLEACRIHGVNPIELVAVPYEEFRKGFPNDDDAARRRYERIDGARKRIFSAVLAEWDQICADERDAAQRASSSPDQAKSAIETLIPVKTEARSTLLEIQAEKFKKLEIDNWNNLQRKINLSIQAAQREQDNRTILKAQEEIGQKNDEHKRLAQRKREELYKQQQESQKRKAAELALEIKKAQEFEAAESYKLEAMKQKERLEAKKRREMMEADRRKREDYTKELKISIYKDMEAQIQQKESVQAKKDEQFYARVNAQKALREKEISVKKEQQRQQSEARKAKIDKQAEDRAAIVKAQLEADTARVAAHKASIGKRSKAAELKAKMLAAKQQGEEILKQKIDKTKAEMEVKDALAKQELDKVKAELERKKNLKMIRQEAFELAASRKKKADDYKEAKLLEQLRIKEEKYQAIKGGYAKLEDMRRTMHEICKKTEYAINDEVHNLQHKNEMSPDAVAKKAVEVSKRVLFPNLHAKFTTTKPAASKSPSRTKSEHSKYRATGDSANAMATWDQFLSTSESIDVPETNGGSASTRAITAPSMSTSKSLSKLDMTRTVGLSIMSPKNFVETVSSSKEKMEKLRADEALAEEQKRAASAASLRRSKRQSPTQTKSDVELLRELTRTSADPLNLDGESSYFEAQSGTNEGEESRLGSSKQESADSNLNKFGQEIVSKKSTFEVLQPVGEGEFRREHSKDHPLAMGSGKYEKEKRAGKVAKTVPWASSSAGKKKRGEESLVTFIDGSQGADYEQTKKQLELLRKQQNEVLLRILEDEKNAEEQRMAALRNTTDPESRTSLELIFAEERKRASERILRQTKENETIIKKAMLAAAMPSN